MPPPPPFSLTPELSWALLRAFGPQNLQARPGDLLLRRNLVAHLGLTQRLVARTPATLLADELGFPATSQLRSSATRRTAEASLLLSLRAEVSDLLSTHRIPCVWLKFAALEAIGAVTCASRTATDIDLLVAPEHLAQISGLLEQASLRRKNLHPSPHQPVVYQAPTGASVELHVHLPYVRIDPNSRFATLTQLKASGLTERLRVKGSPLEIHSRPLLIAHLIAHGLVQHGNLPNSYPVFRLFSDLIDLGVVDNPELIEQARPWVIDDLDPNTFSALQPLCRALCRGEIDELWNLDSPASLLLRHSIAGRLDPSYAARLRLRHFTRSFREKGWMASLREYFDFAFALPKDNLESLYPEARGSSLAWRRVLRPFDFARRALRTLWHAQHGKANSPANPPRKSDS